MFEDSDNLICGHNDESSGFTFSGGFPVSFAIHSPRRISELEPLKQTSTKLEGIRSSIFS